MTSIRLYYDPANKQVAGGIISYIEIGGSGGKTQGEARKIKGMLKKSPDARFLWWNGNKGRVQHDGTFK